jgi:hypothetical protein
MVGVAGFEPTAFGDMDGAGKFEVPAQMVDSVGRRRRRVKLLQTDCGRQDCCICDLHTGQLQEHMSSTVHISGAGTFSPVSLASATNPSSVPGQCARAAGSPARRTTLRSTAVTMIASSA